jgi:Flp pilus assembly pilin Flp
MVTDLTLRVLIAVQGLAVRSRDERGQTLAEYGLILSVVAVATVVTAAVAFRDAIVGSFNDAITCLGGSC